MCIPSGIKYDRPWGEGNIIAMTIVGYIIMALAIVTIAVAAPLDTAQIAGTGDLPPPAIRFEFLCSSLDRQAAS
jgi:hypothetical protein